MDTRRLIAQCIATLLLVSSLAFAQAAEPGPVIGTDQRHVVAGLSDAEIAGRVQAVIEDIERRSDFVGVSVAVARGNHMIVELGVGIADLEWNEPVDAKVPFRIGSVTKQFTATAIMKLKEQGLLGLNDPISKYVPDFNTQGKTVTIRELLNHTSGIANYTAQPGFRTKQSPLDLSQQDVINSIAGVPLDFEPGAKWAYSNTNYFLLGMIIERISGRTYADYLQQEFFSPLGLLYTRYGSMAPIIPRRAAGYVFNPATEQRSNAAPAGMSAPGGAGGLISTAGDLVRWQMALTSGRAVSPASFREMITSTVRTGMGDAEYGFGLTVDRASGQRRIGHNGAIEGFNSVLSWLPDLGLSIAVISNCEGLPSEAVGHRIFAALTTTRPLPPLRKTPQLGAEAALRNLISGIAAGKPDYAALTQPMAELTRAQLPALKSTIQRLGTLESITFKGVRLDGADKYLAHFVNGEALFTISLDEQSKVGRVGLMPLQQANGS